MRTNARQRQIRGIKPWHSEFLRFAGGFVAILGCSLVLLFVFQFALS